MSSNSVSICTCTHVQVHHTYVRICIPHTEKERREREEKGRREEKGGREKEEERKRKERRDKDREGERREGEGRKGKKIIVLCSEGQRDCVPPTS